MAMDPLEREHWRRKIAARMAIFLESTKSVSCVSGHYYEEPHACELCQTQHAHEVVVIKNRANKKLSVGVPCLKEMVRFRVTDVDEFPRWLEKIGVLKEESEKRRQLKEAERAEERKKLEKKFMVRKRT